jgi:hypothetical protein
MSVSINRKAPRVWDFDTAAGWGATSAAVYRQGDVQFGVRTREINRFNRELGGD